VSQKHMFVSGRQLFGYHVTTIVSFLASDQVFVTTTTLQLDNHSQLHVNSSGQVKKGVSGYHPSSAKSDAFFTALID